MRLCVINNIIMLFIIIVLGKISYNILRNKKNYETFTNSGWKLNHDGQLCNDSNCKDISVLGSGDSGKICTISGDTLNCEKIEEGDGEPSGDADKPENNNGNEPENNDGVPSVDNDNIVYSVNANGEKDNNLEFNNDTNILTFYEPEFITVIEMEPAYHYREISIKVDDVPVDITISNEVDNTYYKNNNTNVLINKKFSESTQHSDWFVNNYEKPLRIKLLNNGSNDLSNSTNKIELNYASKETKDATEISVNYELMTNELGKVISITKVSDKLFPSFS